MAVDFVYESLSGRPVPFSLRLASRFKAIPEGPRYESRSPGVAEDRPNSRWDRWLEWTGETYFRLESGIWIHQPENRSDAFREVGTDQVLRWFRDHAHHLRYDSDGAPVRAGDPKAGWTMEYGIPEVLLADIRSENGQPITPIRAEQRRPSLDLIRGLNDALGTFMERVRVRHGPAVMQEDYLLGYFLTIADFIERIRPDLDRVEGWPSRIGRALRILCDRFDELARAWGWEPLLRPDRDEFIKAEFATFHESVERPWYEAAIAWQSGCTGLDIDRDVDQMADEGRTLGYTAPPDGTDGLAQYQVARRAWIETPRLGRVYPRFSEDLKGVEQDFQRVQIEINTELTQAEFNTLKAAQHADRVPSRDRVCRIALDAQALLQAVEDAKHHTDRSLVLYEHWRVIFDRAARLDTALGATPGGDEELRDPSGWDAGFRLRLMEIASAFEALAILWGLRGWENDANGRPRRSGPIRWPDFGDIRCRPFDLNSGALEEIRRLTSGLANLAGPETASDPTPATPVDPNPIDSMLDASSASLMDEDLSPESPAEGSKKSGHGALEADPIGQTLTMLKRGRSQQRVNFFSWLAERDGHEATMEVVVTEFYRRKHLNQTGLETARKCAERLRDYLEHEDCPMRVVISASTVRLLPRESVG